MAFFVVVTPGAFFSALLLIVFSLYVEHEVVRTVLLQHANLHNVKQPANLHGEQVMDGILLDDLPLIPRIPNR